MSERPGTLLAGLLLAAGTAAALLLGGVAGVAAAGFDVLAATGLAALSACVLFLMGLEQLPLSPVVIVLFAAASTAAFAWTLVVSVREARLHRALPLRPIGDPAVRAVARASGLRAVYSIPASEPSAFCVGILRPRVVLTEGLLGRLDGDERAAVVWHEAAHAHAYEPLRSALARLAVRTFFWLPLLGDLLDRYLLAREVEADRRATAQTSRRALAGALIEVAGRPTPAATVGLAELAAARVDRLFDPGASLPRLFRARSVVLTLGSAGTLLLALAFPATLGSVESERMWSMLTSDSLLHGFPAMLAGVLANVLVLTAAAKLVRRVGR